MTEETSSVGNSDINCHEADKEYLPSEVVEELDRFIVAQDAAKRSVALALRSRWRRLQVPEPLRQEITPKNILMIGPTGVGKTEIARRLAKLTKAPFVKVEASKFTEVGYIGRDVDSIIRDLLEVSANLVREESRDKMRTAAEKAVEDQLLKLIFRSRLAREKEKKVSSDPVNDSPDDIIVPIQTEIEDGLPPEGSVFKIVNIEDGGLTLEGSGGNPLDPLAIGSAAVNAPEPMPTIEELEVLRSELLSGALEDEQVEIEIIKQISTHVEILGPSGFAEMEGQLKDMLTQMMPKAKEKRKLTVSEARDALLEESLDRLVEPDDIRRQAVHRAEESGIIFIDEIDKICGSGAQSKGPDVSREGVQRDLLPLVEGSMVSTKYGQVKTDHMLFIASGAFHFSKPSDLMPEFQGRFPIRVELESLTAEHFFRILNEPDNALPKQYQALLQTEGLDLQFKEDALEEIAKVAAQVNERIENIGARRLHTLLERILEEVSFVAHEKKDTVFCVDKDYVLKMLNPLLKDDDLSRFIL